MDLCRCQCAALLLPGGGNDPSGWPWWPIGPWPIDGGIFRLDRSGGGLDRRLEAAGCGLDLEDGEQPKSRIRLRMEASKELNHHLRCQALLKHVISHQVQLLSF
ncbi:hypothetical protein Dimus_027074 [Dionaea muscipula]